MKRQLTLGGRLMVGLALVMIPVSAAILVMWFGYLNPRLEKSLFQVVKRGTIASANVVANKYAFEIAASAEEDLRKNFEEELAGNKDTVAYILFDGDRKLRLEMLRDKQAKFEHLYKDKLKAGKESSSIIGEYVVALVPVMAEESVNGYLIYIESISEYRDSQFTMFVGVTSILLIGFLVISLGIAAIGRRAAKPIERIALSAQRIAGGDLKQIEQKAEGVAETSKLAAAVQDMAEALSTQVISIKGLTDNASSVSQDVARAMAHLATSASEQAAAVAETASTVEEMEKTGKSAAANARQIVEAAEKTTEASIRGRQAVDTTSDIILKIKDDSQQISARSKSLLSNVEEIGNIISSVNAIAEQSKILAVNASIEAAKAGEYGSGFAVVAQEVKDLAQQSKEATEQITNTLTSIRKAIEGMVDLAGSGERRTEKGVMMVANAGAIVNDLSEAIRENSDVANVINTSVTQQTLGLSQIAAAIEQINISATENQEISHQIEQSTKSMTESLEKLAELVDKWRTDDENEDESDEEEAHEFEDEETSS